MTRYPGDAFMANSGSRPSSAGVSRREHERYPVMDDLLSGAFEKDPESLIPFSILDISRGGLAFALSNQSNCLSPGEQITLRIFINKSETFLPCTVQIVSVQKIPDGRYRHGAKLVAGSLNEGALFFLSQFVKSAIMVNSKKGA
jgi:hypothetical protein